MANTNNPGLRKMTHSPEELERFAALFIPTWELPAEVATGPDPGFKPAAIDPAMVAALSPQQPPPAEKPAPIKNTMIAVAVQVPKPEPVAPVIAAAPLAPPAPVAAAPLAPPKAFTPATSIDDDEFAPKKSGSGKIVAILAAVAVLGGVGAFIAFRGGEKEKSETKEAPAAEKPTEKKAMDLPEPTPAPAAEPKAAAPEPTKAVPEPTKEPPAPKETAAAKEPAPPPKAEPPAKAAPPPPPPVKAAPPPPPPPVAKAAPPPPPPPAAKAPPPAKKAAPKIKDEF